MYPAIHFDCLEHKKWKGRDCHELCKEMEKLRKDIKKASNYYWDNCHFFIDDGYGKTVLTVMFCENQISVWVYPSGVFVGDFKPESLDTVFFSSCIDQASEGKSPCCQCKKWVKDIVFFGFAGGACKDCYDPKKHLPPDTSGS